MKGPGLPAASMPPAGTRQHRICCGWSLGWALWCPHLLGPGPQPDIFRPTCFMSRVLVPLWLPRALSKSEVASSLAALL